MPTSVYKAAIIIPHYNDSERLMRCLNALSKQMNDDCEAIVVDNGSSQPPVTQHPFRVVVERSKGAAQARNRGVAETTAQNLFFLDCDCVPSRDWVKTAFHAVSLSDVVGGQVTVFDETPPPRSGAEAFETVFAFENDRYIEEKGFSVTANLLTTRDVFEQVGPFRPGLSEDLDWCHRARAKGFELVYHKHLTVAHPTRSNWSALRKKWLRLTQEAYGLNGSQKKDRVRWAAKAIAMPFSIIVHIPKILRSPELRKNEKWLAICTLWRLRLLRMTWMLRQACYGDV